MKKIVPFIVICLLGLSFGFSAEAQIPAKSFMSFPGDEDLPIGVYPNKEDSLKDGTGEPTGEDSTGGGGSTTKTPPKEGSKDAFGKPAGTLYSQGDIWTTVAGTVGTATETTNTTDGPENWLGQLGSSLYDMPLPVKAAEDDDEPIQFKLFSISDNPPFKKKLSKYLNKKSSEKKWVSNNGLLFYFSKNTRYKYFYIYITDKKPNSKKPVPAKRFRILTKKSKVLFYRA